MTMHKKPSAKKSAVTHSQRRSKPQHPARKSGSGKAAATQDATPKSPAEQALPRPFIGQAISLLAEVLKFERPADGVLSQYFKTHRELGHTDRGRLAELIYAVLRHLSSLREVVGRSAPPEGHEARYLVLAALIRLQNRNLREIEHLLKGDETDWFGRLKAAGQEKTPESQSPAVRHEWPTWLEEALAAMPSMPDSERDALARSLLQPAPLDLRINPVRAKRPEILAQLEKHGIVAAETPFSPWGMRVEGKPAIQRHPAFEKGDMEVQDEGSQLLVALLAPKRGEMVLDFCAGAGGKTLLMGALMKNSAVSTPPIFLRSAWPNWGRAWPVPGSRMCRPSVWPTNAMIVSSAWPANLTAFWWMRRAQVPARCVVIRISNGGRPPNRWPS